MRAILRNTGSILAGFMVASIVMMIIESINGHVLYPGLAKAAQGVTDREGIRIIFASAPVGALLVVVIGWGLGGLTGGWVTRKIAIRGTKLPGYLLCALLTLAGVANNLMLPPPIWFWAASLVVLTSSTLAAALPISRHQA